jgi:hypothetical protein
VDFGGKRAETIDALHRKYGKVVLVGPSELSFTGAEAMQKIYGAGPAFYKSKYFYDIFIAFSSPLLFTNMIVDRCLQSWTTQVMLRVKSYSLKFIQIPI